MNIIIVYILGVLIRSQAKSFYIYPALKNVQYFAREVCEVRYNRYIDSLQHNNTVKRDQIKNIETVLNHWLDYQLYV